MFCWYSIYHVTVDFMTISYVLNIKLSGKFKTKVSFKICNFYKVIHCIEYYIFVIQQFLNYRMSSCDSYLLGDSFVSDLMLWVRIRARCTTLCDKVWQWLAADRWFAPGTPVSSTNKTERHDITEILFKVALNIITLTPYLVCLCISFHTFILLPLYEY